MYPSGNVIEIFGGFDNPFGDSGNPVSSLSSNSEKVGVFPDVWDNFYSLQNLFFKILQYYLLGKEADKTIVIREANMTTFILSAIDNGNFILPVKKLYVCPLFM